MIQNFNVLLEKLQSSDESVSFNAALDLAEQGETLAIPVLIRALGHQSDTVRFFFAGKALQGFGQTAVPALLEALQQTGKIRSGAAQILYEMDPANRNMVLPIALQALADSDEAAQMDAVQLISQMTAEAQEAAPALIPLLHRKSDESKWKRDARMLAALVLGVIGEPRGEIIATLLQTMESQEESIAWGAISALSLLGPVAKSAVPALLYALHDANRLLSIRLAAMRALAVIAEPNTETLPALLGILQKEGWVMRLMSVRFLSEMSNPNPEPWTEWLQSGGPIFGRLHTRQWQRITHTKPVVAALRAALQDKNLDVQRNVVYGLGQMGSLVGSAVPDLIPLLSRPELSGAVAETLARIGGVAIEAVSAILPDPYAAYALSKMDHPLAQQRLKESGVTPLEPDEKLFCLPEIPMELDTIKQAAFDRLWQETLAQGMSNTIAYHLPYPKHEFLTYLARHKGLMMHGSNNLHIDILKPLRNSTDSQKHGNVSGIYGEADGIRPIYFATIDRSQVTALVNGSEELTNEDGGKQWWYFLSIDTDAWLRQPWTTGAVYIMPPETFVLDNEWTSREPVQPLARLPVTHNDLPYPIWAVELQRHRIFVSCDASFPFLDEVQMFPIRATAYRSPAADY